MRQCLYLPADLVRAVREEAVRLDRSISWVVQRCVVLALPHVRTLPAAQMTMARPQEPQGRPVCRRSPVK